MRSSRGVLIALLVTSAACNSSPASPTPAVQGPVAPPTGLTAVPQARSSTGNAYDLRWSATPDARVPSFVVEVGTTSGGGCADGRDRHDWHHVRARDQCAWPGVRSSPGADGDRAVGSDKRSAARGYP